MISYCLLQNAKKTEWKQLPKINKKHYYKCNHALYKNMYIANVILIHPTTYEVAYIDFIDVISRS